jgi:hypothetical protein
MTELTHTTAQEFHSATRGEILIELIEMVSEKIHIAILLSRLDDSPDTEKILRKIIQYLYWLCWLENKDHLFPMLQNLYNKLEQKSQ